MKEFLSRKGVPYVERDVSRDPTAAGEMVQRSGQRGVPVIVVDDQVVIGFDRDRLESLLSGPGAARPSLGASVADASEILSRRGEPPRTGAYVGRVRAGSAAERAGIRAGDIIVAFGNHPVQSAADVSAHLAALAPGSRLVLSVLREGNVLRLETIV